MRGGRGRWGDPVERVQLKPDIIVTGPAFAEPVQVITTIPVGDAVKLVGKGLRTNQVHEALLTSEQLASLTASPEHPAFDGDPQRFRLGIEAHRLGLVELLQERRLNQAKLAKSAFSELSREIITDPTTLPCRSPRVAFRDVARATDSRTVHAALLPPDVVITNKGPYFLWPEGDERDQSYLLGVLASVPLDWYSRRWVEVGLNYHILYAFPIPRPVRDHGLRRRIEELSGRLAAVDDRYTHWAAAVGVPIGSVSDPAEKADMIAELDAAVSLLYGLEEADVRHIFETFHVGWDYTSRLDAVLAHFRRLKEAR